MKRAVIVHCWSGSPQYCWYPWVKAQLEQRGFRVTVPAMPDADAPKLATWLPALIQTVGEPDEELYLIGHSIGSVTILRYLEQLPEQSKVGGIVLVAGFTDPLGFKELENFFSVPLDLEGAKEHLAKGAVLVHSDDDPYVSLHFGHELKEKLGAELKVLPGMKHFSGPVDREDSCAELPAVVQAVERLSRT
jgi:predicted alpha/beta hydrolase family esterase